MDMQSTDTKNETDKVCIIGAGSSGLAAAKTFAERGIPFDCLEREDDIGGLWNETTGTGVVYDTTYLVSSRKYTGFEDYPMPEDYPTYPSTGDRHRSSRHPTHSEDPWRFYRRNHALAR